MMNIYTFLVILQRFPIIVVIGIAFIYEKVLLKLSSKVKLRNFDIGMKMIAVAPHHRSVQPLLASYISFGVGYCFIHSNGNAKTRL